ncbi:hypothetical protein GCG54_00006180 [Colletotrichum gloeosporioides]|uniref:Uncharacterized protein n=2 Tax=Colletotrichum gloeosporioides TaxID=474922 RepID=T0K4A6_COLGC|nr:uncharacterized protein GCG54_00006180 [Colletotrichum gloeosporioides]EQB46679.1 hypothetical protein CGLO_14254 [Colletotrichum gloeosporioides Cg-14]KAF3806416.1 hypothetical protein GCG54_00006180 [Colletotrichum gloeosporioides]
MAIRDHFRRRKSISEPSQGNGCSSPESKSPGALRLAKTLRWFSKDEKPEKKAVKEKPDPRERPFSETNLRHQEILNGFTLTFGKRQPSRDTRSSYYSIGVSPGTSRHNSVDESPRRMNSVAREGPFVRPVPEEDERV